jgi:ADP-ribosylglycohydrolase
MRTHPIGVIGVGMSKEDTLNLSVDVGWMTHVDPRCTVACCIQVALIRGLLHGDILHEYQVNECIERCYKCVRGNPALSNPSGIDALSEEDSDKLLDKFELERHVYADSLARLNLDERGEIGYMYECLGSAIVVLRAAMRRSGIRSTSESPLVAEKLFEELTADLIMEAGDADTSGAAACALLGAYLGYANLPSYSRQGLAHKEWLMEKTYRLAVATGVIRAQIKPEADEAADGEKGLMSNVELNQRNARLLAEIERKREEAREKLEAGW